MPGFTEISQTEMCACMCTHYAMHVDTLKHWDIHENAMCARQRSCINAVGAVCSCSDTLY